MHESQRTWFNCGSGTTIANLTASAATLKGDLRLRTYDAFLSFDGQADGRLAEEFAGEMRRFARPGHQLLNRPVFLRRKEASMKDWDSIASAIKASNYLILLASESSARSELVQRELSAWIASSPSAGERILIILSGGSITWSEALRDFDFDHSTAIPRTLSGVLTTGPTYIDLRWTSSAPRRIGRPEFSEAVATMVSAISGQSLDSLHEFEFRQKRFAKVSLVAAYAFVLILAMWVMLARRSVQHAIIETIREREQARRATEEAMRAVEISRLNENEAAQLRAEAQNNAREIARLRDSRHEISTDRDKGATLPGSKGELDQTRQLANQYKSDAENARQLALGYRVQADAARDQVDILRVQLEHASNNSKQLGPLGRLKQVILENLGKIAVVVCTCLLIVICSTRLVSLLLQLEVWPITLLAPAFYLTSFGRNKLFRSYRSILSKRIDIATAATVYQDIPYKLEGMDSGFGAGLMKSLSAVLSNKNVVLIADGGRGKSTTCLSLVHALGSGTLTVKGERVEPVLIDGIEYSGDIFGSILSSLLQNGVYGNAAIIAAQIAAGNLYVLLDGYSEIRESYSKDDDKGDFQTFIKRNSQVGILITSRSALPPSIDLSLGTKGCYHLLDLDEATLRPFLSAYLTKRVSHLETLISELEEVLPHLPRIPLMLKLVATVFDEKGTVPQQRSALFSEYASVLFRPSETMSDRIALRQRLPDAQQRIPLPHR